MGKYLRKCEAVGEVAVMEVAQAGVKARARGLAMEAEGGGGRDAKRRREKERESKLSPPRVEAEFWSSSGGHRREVAVSPEDSLSTSGNFGETVHQDCLSSTSSGGVTASCCSSNGSSEVLQDPEEEEEFEVEASTDTLERRETADPSSEIGAENSSDMESTAKVNPNPSPSEASSATAAAATGRSGKQMRPPNAEINEFFDNFFVNHKKEMSEKYNFDFENEKPLPGRYEWVKVGTEEEEKLQRQ